MRVEPDYYKEFFCIAGACKDSCCLAWEVCVDEVSIKRYETSKGEIGERIRSHLIKDEEPHFKMGQDGRCPFLNDENLCDIYIQLGEDALCEICTMHPRFIEEYGDVTEIGIGLSCPTAAKLMLKRENSTKLSIIGEETGIVDEQYEMISSYRDEIFQILRDRDSSIFLRLRHVIRKGEELQAIFNDMPYDKTNDCDEENDKAESRNIIYDWMEEIQSLFAKLDYIGDEFQKIPKTVTYDQLPRMKDEVFYEQLSIYFMYRYFMKCYFDSNAKGKVEFCIISVLYIYIASKFSSMDEMEFARIYSKEIEYSEENMDALREEILFGGCFGTEELKKVLVACENL